MKLRKVLGSFAWVVLAAALILVNAAAANAQDKATENGQTVQTMTEEFDKVFAGAQSVEETLQNAQKRADEKIAQEQ